MDFYFTPYPYCFPFVPFITFIAIDCHSSPFIAFIAIYCHSSPSIAIHCHSSTSIPFILSDLVLINRLVQNGPPALAQRVPA